MAVAFPFHIEPRCHQGFCQDYVMIQEEDLQAYIEAQQAQKQEVNHDDNDFVSWLFFFIECYILVALVAAMVGVVYLLGRLLIR